MSLKLCDVVVYVLVLLDEVGVLQGHRVDHEAARLAQTRHRVQTLIKNKIKKGNVFFLLFIILNVFSIVFRFAHFYQLNKILFFNIKNCLTL